MTGIASMSTKRAGDPADGLHRIDGAERMGGLALPCQLVPLENVTCVVAVGIPNTIAGSESSVSSLRLPPPA